MKSQERHSLAKELMQLANQSSSFSGDSTGLRDAGGTADSVEDSLSWDFEGLNVKGDKRSQGSSQHEQIVVRIKKLVHVAMFSCTCERFKVVVMDRLHYRQNFLECCEML